MPAKLIVLDRDGVINVDSADYIKSPEEWLPIEGSIEAIAKLKLAGFKVAIATNQSGIGRGYYNEATLDKMHDKMQGLLAAYKTRIDFIAYCPHKPDDNCNCRKPKAGLFDQIEQGLNVSLNGCIVVGDSLRDLQAGLIKGMTPVLVRTGKGQETQYKPDLPANTQVFNNLSDFVDDHLNL